MSVIADSHSSGRSNSTSNPPSLSSTSAGAVARFPMPRTRPLVDAKGEIREILSADLKQFAPAAAVLPASLRGRLGVRGPQKEPVKERITIRWSPDVVRRFRATGRGWQARMDAALRDWLKTHGPGSSAR